MDFATLFTENFILVVAVGCLVVGYIIKNATFLKWIPNNDIPVILAFLGAVLNVIKSGIGLETIVYGALNGLMSVGLYEMFRKRVENASGDE